MTLVQINDDLWVNPAHVTRLTMAVEGNPMIGEPYTKVATHTLIYLSDGVRHAVVEKPLAEVVALINGSA